MGHAWEAPIDGGRAATETGGRHSRGQAGPEVSSPPRGAGLGGASPPAEEWEEEWEEYEYEPDDGGDHGP